MDSQVDILKGIHPGKLIERELKKKGLTRQVLSEQTDIPYKTMNAIIAGRRNLTVLQALKIEQALGYKEGFLAILQTYHNIRQYKDNEFSRIYAEPPRIRKSLFWDADFNKINWGKHQKAVIKRVLERGNKDEIEEIHRFYNLTTK
ncbi:MAG TPA: plasmid maintenance system antidote protein [Porphyromonadaceae bacterium]|jgi:plasmid maintenance system antidote protein VapI|uniref:helix-turn-helix transcriptional regulator n=1 Tax=Limibacterium fermenti TaxID=3229863 RepID=UPI000E8B18C8|nr:plasmid maintenance system antidote protein [Porphyromonadaceae bacterium]HBK31171.1 plasmid maintenance system antidote protein [Porphyromonadaceae bacterium]HBL33412.1 plasmid maintenance system antidote protein [Porphyromonadaceae bacterium]HBX45186.1 plasmid maintenance system antidote protein [Porphyromonadaceae bacterium]HCM19381.1 plasmid maintenance system antidote protein [Porphyromonadaceae bacterium]